MATYGTAVRRGLPRRPGGEAWPPAGTAPADVVDAASAVVAAEVANVPVPTPAPNAAGAAPGASGRVGPAAPAPAAVAASVPDAAEAPAPASVAATVLDAAPTPQTAAPAQVSAAAEARTVRRGLPRVAGGEPWPPADFAALVGGAAAADATTQAPVAQTPADAAAPAAAAGGTAAASAPAAQPSTASAPAASTTAPVAPAAAVATGEAVTVRRGLPRVGGEPWPPADFVAGPVVAAEAAPVASEATTTDQPDAIVEQTAPDGETRTTEVVAVAASGDVSQPLPFTRTVWQGAAARRFEAERRSGVKVTPPEPKRIGPFTRVQWAGIVVIGGAALLIAAGMAVALVRWLLSTEWGVDFLAAYPGEYHLPEGAPVGLPAWLGWQHFFNVFLIVLIIRSGLQVRTEKRPSAFWSPRNNPKRKISLNLWFHQSLDILWVVNGVVFVVLLFVTGQWMRIVPTSWEVFPNAISAILQYISLDWPTENGWVNYNSIQQIAYFTTVFLAAPVAIITGVRMSGIWPKNAKAVNKAYPVEWARAVHFPTMLYFVAFIAVHVFLVFATGALRNLNHMYAAQGSVDPNAYADNWAGFWWFFASLVVIAGAWIAARPLVLAPIARLFGSVSGR